VTEALEVSGLRKRYGDVVALDGVHLRVEPGRLLGFLGPNGSGKTTTMRAVLRLVELDAGTVTWGGRPVGDEARRAIGYLPQERGLYARMRVHEQVAYFGRLAGLDRADADAAATRWVDRVGLGDRRDDLVQALSVGNQQRVQLAVALVHGPRLLILDEPFAGLDPVAVANLQRIIVEQVDAGVAVVFSSHQLELVQDLCEDVSIIARGRTIAEGTVQDLRAASTERIVDVGFEDRTIQWMPARSDVRAIRCSPGRTVFAVPAGTRPGVIMDAASAVGALSSISYAPPSLDEVFIELVDSSLPDATRAGQP
jgi:ABC-2 type transport system ATP-binding protein